MKGQKTTTAEEGGVQLPESNSMATARLEDPQKTRLKHDVTLVVMRVACVLSSVAAVCLMVTAKEDSTMSIFGFSLPVYSKWSYSDSFEYLVGVCAVVVLHSVFQLLFSTARLVRKYPMIHSRKHAWLIFIGDQVLAYALMSAGSAASGDTNLNRTGIRHSALPNFCKPLHSFCNQVAVSIAFTFVSWFLLASSAVYDVIWLSSH